MEVIPWFEYSFASIYGDTTGGHIIQANPRWAARDAQGRIATMASISRSNSPFYWMNAIHPEVQQFMIDPDGGSSKLRYRWYSRRRPVTCYECECGV